MQTGKPDDWMLRADGQAENAEKGNAKNKKPGHLHGRVFCTIGDPTGI